jgi:hypothetical protein
VSKTPNLRQPSTGPTIYPAIKLPPIVSVPFTGNSGVPSRTPSAPMIPADKGPSNRPGPMTNTPNQVR